MSDVEDDPGYRSRSQSRRARRKKQTNKQKKEKPFNLPDVPEGEKAPYTALDSSPPHASAKAAADYLGPPASWKQAELQQKSNNSMAYNNADEARKREADAMGMQPFEWIGPDHTSMNGPVTYARAMRGEIPMRPGNPNQKLATGYDPTGGQGEEKSGGDALMDQDGLKLRLELNIDVEIELKARIQGDLTLSLMYVWLLSLSFVRSSASGLLLRSLLIENPA